MTVNFCSTLKGFLSYGVLPVWIIMSSFVVSGCSSNSHPMSADSFFMEKNEDISLTQTGYADGKLPDDPEVDSIYGPILRHWKRNIEVYKDFVLSFQASVVMLSPDMTLAYQNRFSQLTHVPNPNWDSLLVADKDHLSFVVSMFTPNANTLDLDNSKLWTISLSVNNHVFIPSEIKRYRRSEALTPYFPQVSTWGRMYVVSFEGLKPYKKDLQKQDNEASFALTLSSNAVISTFLWGQETEN